MHKEGGQSLVISLFQPKFLVSAEKNCQDICHLISWRIRAALYKTSPEPPARNAPPLEKGSSAGPGRRKAFPEQRQAKERISAPDAHVLPPGNYCAAESARKLLRQMVIPATASDTAVQPERHTENAEAPLPSFNRCLWKPGGSEASSPPLSPAGKERKKAA